MYPSPVTTPETRIEILPEEVWQARQQHHEEAISGLIDDYLDAREQQQKDPILDFLFEYYSFRRSHLKSWSPGVGVGLKVDAGHRSNLPRLDGLTVRDDLAFLDSEQFPEKRVSSITWILDLLQQTQNRPPAFNCFGMHEWAMVYRAEKVRHPYLPMRFPPEQIAEIVESRPLLCTHYDAYRFFTKQAAPMNRFELSRAQFPNTEQPGCIHSNMDLYKWAFKYFPWISSDVIREAFLLALEARTVDMQASPYDLAGLGYEPITVETPEGRKMYVKRQMDLHEKGKVIRQKLIAEYQRLVNELELTAATVSQN